MKTVVAVYGPPDTGKSTTIKRVYELLTAKYPNALVSEKIINHDVRAIIEIDGYKIGIESQGDPSSRLFTSVSLFVREECDIIVCATRTRGQTVEAVENLKPQYDIKWIQKLREPSLAQHAKINNKLASDIFSEVQTLLADSNRGKDKLTWKDFKSAIEEGRT